MSPASTDRNRSTPHGSHSGSRQDSWGDPDAIALRRANLGARFENERRNKSAGWSLESLGGLVDEMRDRVDRLERIVGKLCLPTTDPNATGDADKSRAGRAGT